LKRFAPFAALAALLALTATAFAAGGLSGKYKEKISGDSALGGALNGTWVITLTKGHYKATENGHLIVKGTDTITGKKISLMDTSGPGKCSGTGNYKFKLSGHKLTFTVISDPSASCAGRKGVLTHGPLTKI
jgi:hypothetical protein